MSFVFEIDEETVWSPALRVGEAFVGCAQVLGRVLDVSPGFSFNAEDMVDIDAQQLELFSLALTQISRRPGSHLVLTGLADAVLAPCVVMLDRACRPFEASRDPSMIRLIEEIGASMPQ